MRWFLVFLTSLLLAGQALAEDKGILTRFIEDNLSGAGRQVEIDGFKGALSARASLARLTIADTKGIWLTIEDAVLDWNRAAVLRGEININELTAARIELARLPVSDTQVSAEAGEFSLPDLPVSINIGRINAAQVKLGPTVLGQPVTASVDGSLRLEGGEGHAKLAINRSGGPAGTFRLDTRYENATKHLAVDLALIEEAQGLVSTLLNLPGAPPLRLTAKGDAPLDDFVAKVALETDGQPRLTGQIGTLAAPSPDVARRINADIQGDLTPLFVPEYRDFFGPSVALKSAISLYQDGRMSLDDLTMTASALKLQGQVLLSADRMPERFSLDAHLRDPAGRMVLLPGSDLRLSNGLLQARFDRKAGDIWSLVTTLNRVEHAKASLAQITLNADGTIRQSNLPEVTARIDGTVAGMALADAALAEALGDTATLGFDLDWRKDAPLRVANLEASAGGLNLRGQGQVGGLGSAAQITGSARARVADLSRWSRLAGQQLAGQITANLAGSATMLTGAFDLDLTGTARDLRVGIEAADKIIAGDSTLRISALRDTSGLTLKSAKVSAPGGQISASGQIATGKADLRFDAALNNLGQFVDVLPGPATIKGRALQDAEGWSVTATGAGPRSITAKGTGDLPNGGSPTLDLSAQIGSLGWISPELAGPATLQAKARQSGTNWRINASGTGPGGSDFMVAGAVDPATRNMTAQLTGAAPLALLNRRLAPNSLQGAARFDLSVNGAPALSSVSGQISTRNARLALPALRNALTGIDATVDIANSRARLDASATLFSGGGVNASGGMNLQAPMAADIAIGLNGLRLRDPQLYDTQANGALTLRGTLPDRLALAGQVDLGRVEIRVPSAGLGSVGNIPDIRHVGASATVRRALSRAGLNPSAPAKRSSGSSAVALDLALRAPNQIFVRGRGLDAELGGQLRLTGTTADVIPVGQFDLIRGRLSILGKRLTLQEGSAQLQGSMIPYLRLVAQTPADDADLFVTVEGPANAPEINFSADPDLPGDEVLARMLFGRSITSITPFQALRLASAVRVLAGRGGGVLDQIRENTGIDDLDVTTDTEGATTLSFGKYINDKTYTNVEVGSGGTSRVNLNLELTPTTNLRARVGSDGQTGIGVFFEKDY